MPDKNKNTWGAKLKRTATCLLPIEKNRRGKCNNCGECCKLPNVCLFLKFKKDGVSYCSIHKIRPLTCRKYPRTKDEWLTEGKCGYWFE